MIRHIRRVISGSMLVLSFAAGLTGFSRFAKAQYAQDFNTGAATYTVNDPYWLSNAAANGYIITTTNNPGVFGGAFAADINQDQTGTKYFLFEGTATYTNTAGVSSPTIPAGSDQFFISPSFSVTPNTNYTVSFYLTNADTINSIASIQPDIGGGLIGSPVSAVGTWTSNGWQQFSYSWNSGANTSTSLILHDLTTATSGNDFGIDGIAVTRSAVPEPMTLAAVTILSTGLLTRRRI